MWCIPPEQSAEFICDMENVLEVYRRPYDKDNPVVCMDETSKQLVAETRVPLPSQPGRPQRYDYEYERHGTANIFMFTEPLAGWRKVDVTDRRAKTDWAHEIRRLLEEDYPETGRVTLALDNLNTHGFASLCEAFEPAYARGLINHLELVVTPKHGSWLNIAEIELNILTRQCLARRIGEKETLRREVAIWQDERNRSQTGVDRQLTTEAARIKLNRLYPLIQR
jgi:hypothetical protein